MPTSVLASKGFEGKKKAGMLIDSNDQE